MSRSPAASDNHDPGASVQYVQVALRPLSHGGRRPRTACPRSGRPSRSSPSTARRSRRHTRTPRPGRVVRNRQFRIQPRGHRRHRGRNARQRTGARAVGAPPDPHRVPTRHGTAQGQGNDGHSRRGGLRRLRGAGSVRPGRHSRRRCACPVRPRDVRRASPTGRRTSTNGPTWQRVASTGCHGGAACR